MDLDFLNSLEDREEVPWPSKNKKPQRCGVCPDWKSKFHAQCPECLALLQAFAHQMGIRATGDCPEVYRKIEAEENREAKNAVLLALIMPRLRKMFAIRGGLSAVEQTYEQVQELERLLKRLGQV